MDPPKSDIKGFDFKKSTTSEFSEKFFMGLVNKYILTDDNVNIKGILRDLRSFKDEIEKSIRNGETTFLQNGNVKELNGYAMPEREQSVRGSLTWNMLYPKHQIEFPAKVSLLKLNIMTEEKLKPLEETHPDVYRILYNGVFGDETGMFVQKKEIDDTIRIVNENDIEWYKKIPKKYRAKYRKLGPKEWNDFAEDKLTGNTSHFEYKVSGVQVLAIPQGYDIPDWCQPYIDFSTTINNILSPFNPVLEIFKLPTLSEGKAINGVNRKTETFSNIVKF